ncbi:MAG: DUF4435 domain-containing protein [Pseudomonadota bacterium]
MDSISEHITANTIANQIRLERAAFVGSFLLLEGDNDARLFRKFIDDTACSVEICHSRDRVLEVLRKLQADQFQGVLGIVDQDYAEFVGYPDLEGAVVYSDFNDLEISILSSPALDNVVREFGIIEKAAGAAKAQNCSIAELLFKWVRSLGALRLLSHQNGWALKFQKMKYKFVSSSDPEISLSDTVTHILARSSIAELKSDVVERLAIELLGTIDDDRSIARGHDCVRVLGKALNCTFGNCNDFNSDNDRYRKLAKVLRLAFDFDYFKDTKAYALIKAWEIESDYKVFKN